MKKQLIGSILILTLVSVAFAGCAGEREEEEDVEYIIEAENKEIERDSEEGCKIYYYLYNKMDSRYLFDVQYTRYLNFTYKITGQTWEHWRSSGNHSCEINANEKIQLGFEVIPLNYFRIGESEGLLLGEYTLKSLLKSEDGGKDWVSNTIEIEIIE